MPLLQSNLVDDLERLFESPPETAALCAQQWATIMHNYASTVIPASTTVAAAAAAMVPSLTSIFETNVEASPTAGAMELVFLAFGIQVGAGMAPAWVATAPVGQVGFLPLFERGARTSHREEAITYGNSIHLWMITGQATNSTSGATVSWS